MERNVNHMDNPNLQPTPNRRKAVAASLAIGVTLGLVLGAALGNIALGLAAGIVMGGAVAIWKIRAS